MGSGAKFLAEDTRYDAYCRKIKIIDENDNVVNTKNFKDLDFEQYNVKDKRDTGKSEVQHLVLFGGPGGYTGS